MLTQKKTYRSRYNEIFLSLCNSRISCNFPLYFFRTNAVRSHKKFICLYIIQEFHVNLQFENIVILKSQHNGRRKRPQSDTRRD